MPAHRRVLLVALGLVLALLAGCSDTADTRTPGDPVTQSEAEVLAGLLHRNHTEGGADFTLTAPYAEGTVLTMTGEIDFVRSVARAQAVTDYGDGRPDETRTVFFSAADLWSGDVPGLSEAVAAAGRPGVSYLRRPIATTGAGGTASLVDVLVQLLPRLSARVDDDPRAILERDYTWQGQRSVDGQLAADYRTGGSGALVTVAATSELLLQYVTTLPGQDFRVTVTLADHGPREISLPTDAETATVEEFPQVAASLGI